MTGAKDTLRQFSGVGLLAFGVLAASAIGRLLGQQPALSLNVLPHGALCAASPLYGVAALDGLYLYAANATQLAMFVLLCVMASVAIVVSSAAAHSTFQGWKKDEPRSSKVALLVVYLGGLCVTVGYLAYVGNVGSSGFLTRLLDTLPHTDTCDRVRWGVTAARWVGEGAGFLLGTAMAGVAVIAKPSADIVTERIRWLQRLLYCASLLFVAGLLASGANFAWVLANWTGSSEENLAKAIQAVVKSGTMQAGVGYSALIAVFFVPIRVYLAALTESLVPAKDKKGGSVARSELLKSNGLDVSWWEDAKQILALLAPVLAAPIFDAIANTK